MLKKILLKLKRIIKFNVPILHRFFGRNSVKILKILRACEINVPIKFIISPETSVTHPISFNILIETNTAFECFTSQDQKMIEEMQAFLKLTDKKSCLLDVGALFGIFSLAFTSNNHGKVAYAIEPSKWPFRIINAHIRMNPKLTIKPFQLALGSFNGKLKMEYNWLHLVALNDARHKSNYIEVEVIKLDDFLKKENSIIPDVIKIDTEGSEFDILKGGQEFFKKYEPLIFLELHRSALRNLGISIEHLIELIHSLGYRIYDLKCNMIEESTLLHTNSDSRVICSKESFG